MRLGKVLKRWRMFNDLGVRELAKELGLSHATLARIEGGFDMDTTTFKKILDWLMTEAVE